MNPDAVLQETVCLKNLSKTMLPNDELSILVDLGSKINCIGLETERLFATQSMDHGLPSKYLPRAQRLNINGVGRGSAPCDVEAVVPIAVKFQDQPATKETFRANVAQGCGAHLPAIIGLKSMTDKVAVLILRKDGQMMALPGPSGYKIEWGPGTKLISLVEAPSGHLVIPCGHFRDLPRENAPSEQLSFVTDHTHTIDVPTPLEQPE